MRIERTTTVGMALMAHPNLYMPLLTLGLCCVDEDTAMWTMERLAQETGRDADEVCAVLNGVLQ